MGERLCLLDFDDTLIAGDSLKLIMKREGWLFSPSLFLAGVGIAVCRLFRRDELKARSRFKYLLLKKYGKLSEEKKNGYIRMLRERIRPELVSAVKDGKYDRVVVLSASEEALIREVMDGVLSLDEIIASHIGAEQGPEDFRTCYGGEKRRRLKEAIPDYADCDICVYTDSYSDQPLIELAGEAFLVEKGGIRRIKEDRDER
ncbi:MAG: haloacid dehalogenase-like hydrolase [Lachnospiraceae bacterium]|nr:haloacid dehalogenase-like hydrolase [Lachnospiraceae bacterium]